MPVGMVNSGDKRVGIDMADGSIALHMEDKEGVCLGGWGTGG